MKKIISILTILIFTGAPLVINAQNQTQDTTDYSDLSSLDDYPDNNTNTQAFGATQGVNNQGQSFGSGAASGAISSCAGGLIGGAVSSYLTNILGGMTDSGTTVPTTPISITAKEVGLTMTGGISWDAIGYCLINSIIEYIGHATVQWINTGFQGNPVFVEDPAQFFSDIADMEAGAFLSELSGGYLCSPLQTPVRINLATRYNNSVSPYSQRGRCTFTGISGNLEQFISGQSFSWDDWLSYTTNPNNNAFGATLMAGIELDRRIANSVGVESKLLDWGRGFLSFRDPETGKISSPGSVIEEQLNKQLDNPRQRLLMADEFDEIVTALVNQLVKVALNELTDSGSSSSRSSSARNYNNNLLQQQFNQTVQNVQQNNSGTLICRYDTNSNEEYEYNGDCFPSQWMKYPYQSTLEVPIRANLCNDLPADLDPESEEARQYYDGKCIPPTERNTNFLEENELINS